MDFFTFTLTFDLNIYKDYLLIKDFLFIVFEASSAKKKQTNVQTQVHRAGLTLSKRGGFWIRHCLPYNVLLFLRKVNDYRSSKENMFQWVFF